jgi:hypothetical protein
MKLAIDINADYDDLAEEVREAIEDHVHVEIKSIEELR